ncbi:MAG: isochorismatase family cysteine hydrolase [Verrucomicrobiota bacterium]|nr:isochorismatase family cysteine hydrolase [Verrucomicrobiota bacterium]
MPTNPKNVSGENPQHSSVALLLIDVINDLDFDQGAKMAERAKVMADRIVGLRTQARNSGVPVIYVNDNFGRWQSDFRKLIQHCLGKRSRGRFLVRKLRPDSEKDYFVLKPKHSGFYSTTLDLLLEHLGVKTLVLTGIAGNNCVLFTANDAYMRDFRLIVPKDCVVSNSQEENDSALKQMATVLKADISPSTKLNLAKLAKN